jgi:hypothetical protein
MNYFLRLPRSCSVSMLLILALTSLPHGCPFGRRSSAERKLPTVRYPFSVFVAPPLLEQRTTSTRKLVSINVRYRPLPVPRTA